VVGKRPEYTLPLTQEEKASNVVDLRTEQEHSNETNQAVNLPPIPERQDQPAENDSELPAAPLPNPPPAPPAEAAELAPPAPPPLPASEASLPDQAPLAPLPLPVAAGDGAAEAQGDGANQEGNDNNNILQPGIFVQNDTMDEGVKLVSKFQHGTVAEEQQMGTRSGRGKVKVLLFARCPIGGHFATGASDGTCRIWEDIDDPDVETVDERFCNSPYDWLGDGGSSKERRRSGTFHFV
jgi:hypothetical protein